MTSFWRKTRDISLDIALSSIYAIIYLFEFGRDQVDKVAAMMHSPPKKQDSPPQAPPFKEQLDQKADESRAREHGSGGESIIETVVHKISQAIPAQMHVLGGSNPDGKVEDEAEAEAEAGPPHRPENDVQIEEFVREQHRSKFAGETSNS
ncbi:hypothetical protein ACSS6W_009173 [Trichoderma asperelloides]|nr:hypothetical protein LI328DRAFT_132722 [Trichoderma asperelloides]